jgi:hypothetical protein
MLFDQAFVEKGRIVSTQANRVVDLEANVWRRKQSECRVYVDELVGLRFSA